MRVNDVADIEEWLRRCEYQSDHALFRNEDYWQHPCEFEVVQAGDCEDHALWAWRKFMDLGLPCSFVVGKYRPDPAPRHAWVMARVSGERILFEATQKSRGALVVSMEDARRDYEPLMGIDHRLRTKVFLAGVGDFFTLPGPPSAP